MELLFLKMLFLMLLFRTLIVEALLLFVFFALLAMLVLMVLLILSVLSARLGKLVLTAFRGELLVFCGVAITVGLRVVKALLTMLGAVLNRLFATS